MTLFLPTRWMTRWHLVLYCFTWSIFCKKKKKKELINKDLCTLQHFLHPNNHPCAWKTFRSKMGWKSAISSLESFYFSPLGPFPLVSERLTGWLCGAPVLFSSSCLRCTVTSWGCFKVPTNQQGCHFTVARRWTHNVHNVDLACQPWTQEQRPPCAYLLLFAPF